MKETCSICQKKKSYFKIVKECFLVCSSCHKKHYSQSGSFDPRKYTELKQGKAPDTQPLVMWLDDVKGRDP